MLFAILSSTLFAQSTYEREFKQITDQRDKAISSATEAINQNYQKSLRQLLLRATQNSDTKVISAIAEALKGSERPRADFIGLWVLKTGNWTAINDVKADGTIRQDNTNGTWTATETKLKCNYDNGAWVEFDLPARDGKLFGVTNKKERMTATRKSE